MSSSALVRGLACNGRAGKDFASGADAPGERLNRRRDEDGAIETRVLTAGAIRLDPPGLEITVEAVYTG
ncbi:hypothetical protein [Rhodopila sp.]|uniref:hypothetical protein n=1 Tax=Rhodopila sp. TaxID=2480087 RepID=UPI003D136CEF